MEDIKDLVSSLTITGVAVLRNPKARQQLMRMIWIQTWKSRRTIRTTLLRSLLVLTLSYIASKYFVYRAFIHSANRYPGPPLDLWPPLSGHLGQLLSQEAGVVYRAWYKKYGPVIRYFGGGNDPRVLVSDPELVRRILTEPGFKPHLTLPTNNAEKEWMPSIVEPIEQLVEQWRQHCDTTRTPTEIVVSQGLRLVALDIFTRTVVGESVNAIHHPHRHPLSRAYLSQTLETKWTLWDEFKPKWRRKTDGIEQEILALVASHQSTQPNLLAKWRQEQPGASLTDLQQQAMTVLNSGHETVHGVASWCLYHLAQDIDLQSALRADLASTSDLDTLPLLDNLCKEALRWTPVISESHHIVKRNHDRLKRGTHVVISPLVLHFDHKYWGQDVDRFLPSRWNTSPANQIDPFVYLPGVSALEMMQLKWVMGLLVRHFKFTTKAGFSPRHSLPLSCRPLPNMTLIVETV